MFLFDLVESGSLLLIQLYASGDHLGHYRHKLYCVTLLLLNLFDDLELVALRQILRTSRGALVQSFQVRVALVIFLDRRLVLSRDRLLVVYRW